MTDKTWRNDSVPGLSPFGAFMEYLPVGEQGALVIFGGQGFQASVLGAPPCDYRHEPDPSLRYC